MRLFPLPQRCVCGVWMNVCRGRGGLGLLPRSPSWVRKGCPHCSSYHPHPLHLPSPPTPPSGLLPECQLCLLQFALGKGLLLPPSWPAASFRTGHQGAQKSQPSCLSTEGWANPRPDSQNLCSSHGSVTPYLKCPPSWLRRVLRSWTEALPVRVPPSRPSWPGLHPIPQPG